MEVAGGIMIMLALLGLLFASVWLSLPILFMGLLRRMERIELRITAFEHRLDRIQESLQDASQTDSKDTVTEISTGGLDGTA